MFYLNYSGQNVHDVPEGLDQILRYVLFGLLFAGPAVSYFLYKSLLSGNDLNEKVSVKFAKLQGFVLIRAACLEGPALFGAVAAMLTRDNSFLLFSVVFIFMMILWRPTRSSVEDDLQLNEQEKLEFL